MRSGLSAPLRRAWLHLTLLCGALHAAWTSLAARLYEGGDPAALWRGVAAVPFGEAARQWGAGGAALGLAVHFALMALIAALGLTLARRTVLGDVAAWKAGALFGIALYAVIHGLVLPWRFGTAFPDPDRLRAALALFADVILVGLPIFWLVRRRLPPS